VPVTGAERLAEADPAPVETGTEQSAAGAARLEAVTTVGVTVGEVGATRLELEAPAAAEDLEATDPC
jgi:hypothetical protein